MVAIGTGRSGQQLTAAGRRLIQRRAGAAAGQRGERSLSWSEEALTSHDRRPCAPGIFRELVAARLRSAELIPPWSAMTDRKRNKFRAPEPSKGRTLQPLQPRSENADLHRQINHQRLDFRRSRALDQHRQIFNEVLINEQCQHARLPRLQRRLGAALPESVTQFARGQAVFHLAPDLFGRARLFAQIIFHRAGVLQVAEVAVTTVEATGIGLHKPLHAHHEVWLRGLHHQVEMIAHQTIRVDLPIGLLAGVPQGGEQALAIHVVQENGLTAVATIHDACPAIAPSGGG